MEKEEDTKAQNLLQNGLAVLVNAVKVSNELPSSGTNYAFYNSFPAYQTLMNAQASKILTITQKCINFQEARGSVLESFTKRAVNDRFESLVEVNDQLLEKINSCLDEAAGLRPAEADLVVASASTSQPGKGRRFGRFSINSDNSNVRQSSTQRENASRSERSQVPTGRNVIRPQLNFSEPPDNSPGTFRPRLKTKPNALRPLNESLIVDADETEKSDLAFPHPYQLELEKFQPTAEQIQPHEKEKTSRPIEETPLTFIRTRHALEELVKLLKTEKEIAVDLEAHSYRTYLGMTCLMQLSTWTNDFIVDTLALWDDMEPLNEVFTDPKIVKVFHDATSDILWLQRDFGLYVVNLYDTSIAARLLGARRVGLLHLLQNHCNVSTKKEYQLADWRVRPLPDPMVEYARTDTHYLLEICNRQKHMFIERGRGDQIESVWSRGREKCLSRYEKPPINENSHLDVYYNVKKTFNAQQLYILKNLYTWRDEVARLEDESPTYVLPNHMLIMISDTLPREQAGIFACCNPIPSLVRKYIHDIHKLVTLAREIEVVKESTDSKFEVTPAASSTSDLPHDLSHTDVHEPMNLFENVTEKDIVKNLSNERQNPVIRFRSVGGPGGSSGGRNFVDPLEQYRLSNSCPRAPPAANGSLIKSETETNSKATPPPLPNTRPPPSPPAPQQNPTAGDGESFRLQKPGKKKKAKRKIIEEAKEEITDSAHVPSPPKAAAEFLPFDYSKAKLPASNIPMAEDRMMNDNANFKARRTDGDKSASADGSAPKSSRGRGRGKKRKFRK